MKMIVLLVLWGAVFIPVYPELVRDWLSHSDNSHGFIVPLMVGYFIWQRKDQMVIEQISFSWVGGVILFLSLLLYEISYAGDAAFLSRLALVLSLFGIIWFNLGTRLIKILAFPIFFLLFMIPVPYSFMSLVSLPLQLAATKISAQVINVCSIPVYREGNMLYFVATQLEVAEACSGIRSIMTLLMLAIAFASMMRDGWVNKLLLVASAIPVAMLANIIRISGTGILAHFYGDKVARGFLHEFSGLAIFAFGFVVLLGIYTLINRKGCGDT